MIQTIQRALHCKIISKTTENKASTQTTNVKLWHSRLGHLGLRNLQKLISLVDGMKLPSEYYQELEEVCDEVCTQAKQTRIPFNKSRQRPDTMTKVHGLNKKK